MAESGPNPVQRAEVLSLFPSQVWWTKLEDGLSQRINTSVKARLEQMTREQPALEPGARWQTEQRLHELPELTELNECIHGAVNGVLEYLKIPSRSFMVTACWANITAPGGPHKPHTHPNNFLSGVYYVQTASGADTIAFHDPRPQTRIIRPPAAEYGPENADKIDIRVEDGVLVVFPAWLMHSVPPNDSTRERISVSFNVMFTAYAESMGGPQWTGNLSIDED